MAAGGFISTAQELLKRFSWPLRNTGVLPAAAISEMLNDGIGWFPYAGNYGTYYQKDGGLHNGDPPQQTLNTCVVRLAEGYDIALVANTQAPLDVVNICAGAFDSRGLLVTDLPPGIATVIGAATYLPKAAPAAYCAIMGAGFTNRGGNRLEELDHQLDASYFGRRHLRQREREPRVCRVRQRDSSEFSPAVEHRRRDRRLGIDHANRSDELDV